MVLLILISVMWLILRLSFTFLNHVTQIYNFFPYFRHKTIITWLVIAPYGIDQQRYNSRISKFVRILSLCECILVFKPKSYNTPLPTDTTRCIQIKLSQHDDIPFSFCSKQNAECDIFIVSHFTDTHRLDMVQATAIATTIKRITNTWLTITPSRWNSPQLAEKCHSYDINSLQSAKPWRENNQRYQYPLLLTWFNLNPSMDK